MDRKAMYKLSYGLFVLTAREDEKDNGCIINTAIQAASEPNQLSICVNKAICKCLQFIQIRAVIHMRQLISC